MDPIIDLAPGAEDNPLAVELAARIRTNVAAHPKKRADFRSLRGSVLVVAQDEGESLTLRFDHGRLTIHDGNVGIPWVTLCADLAVLRALPDVPLSRFLRLPLVGSWTGEAGTTARRLLGQLATGEIKVYGLTAHPRTVVCLLRVLSSR